MRESQSRVRSGASLFLFLLLTGPISTAIEEMQPDGIFSRFFEKFILFYSIFFLLFRRYKKKSFEVLLSTTNVEFSIVLKGRG